MKKNIIKLFGLLIATSFVFVSCTEELLKSDYDHVIDASKLPSLDLAVSQITGSTVNCAGSLTINGDTAIIERGFVCATNSEFTENKVSAKADASFSTVIEDLSGATNYYVKAYIITSNGIAYSQTLTFKTRALVTLLDYNLSNLSSNYGDYSVIDKDGDNKNWSPTYYDTQKTQICFISYSWYNAALTPENYLLFPAVTLPADIIFPKVVVSLEPADLDYPGEVYKIIISDSPITSDNCQSVTQLYKGTMTKDGAVDNVVIPDSYIGKTVYLGVCHFDCSDNYALIYTGHKIIVTQ